MGRLRSLKSVWPFNSEKPFKLTPVGATYAFFAIVEILLGLSGWWYYAWGSGYRLVFLALTVFLFLIFTKINGDLASWLNSPRKKKEAKKKPAAKKKTESRFKHHL